MFKNFFAAQYAYQEFSRTDTIEIKRVMVGLSLLAVT
jgi:hypothetical protein